MEVRYNYGSAEDRSIGTSTNGSISIRYLAKDILLYMHHIPPEYAVPSTEYGDVMDTTHATSVTAVVGKIQNAETQGRSGLYPDKWAQNERERLEWDQICIIKHEK
jgi:hypothetical protein